MKICQNRHYVILFNYLRKTLLSGDLSCFTGTLWETPTRKKSPPPFPLFYFPLSSLTNLSIQESMGNRYVKYYSTCWKSLSREKTRPSAPRQTKLAFRNSKFHSFFVSQFPWAIRNFSFQGIIVAVYNMEINYVGPQLHGENISRQAFDWRDGLMS